MQDQSPPPNAQNTPATAGASRASATVRLRIMATSDMHMHLAAYDYYTDQPCIYKGLALTASLIANARAEAPDALLFDNGDFLQGSPLGDFLATAGDMPNPAIEAMNQLRYDAVNIGNHEFSFGVSYLRAALAKAAFPCLSANTHSRAATGALSAFLPPVALLTRELADADGCLHRVQIGVIGVLPPQTAVWDRQAIGGAVALSDMTSAVARHAPALRRAGADVVIVLAHSGIGAPDPGPMAENVALAIAGIDAVDAVVMGHVHLPFPGPDTPASPGVDPVAGTLAGKPAVMAGVFGSHLGIIDLELQAHPFGWRVATHRSEARAIAPRTQSGDRIAATPADPALSALIAPAHRAALDWARRPIGHTAKPIHSYFAMVTASAALQVVTHAQARYVGERLRGGPFADIPLLSATAPFKAGGHAGPENYSFVPAGDLLLRHAADLYIHPNTIVALRLTGAEVRQWLARSARVFNQLTPGTADQMLLDPDMASFNFDLICGVSYAIDLIAAPGSVARIRDLRWQGRPVADGDPFILATNSYRSSGSGGFLSPDPARPDATRIVLADQKSNRDLLISYLSDDAYLADAATPVPPQWRFAPCANTSALFDSAPESIGYLPEVPHLHLTPLTRTPHGFQRYRLTL